MATNEAADFFGTFGIDTSDVDPEDSAWQCRTCGAPFDSDAGRADCPKPSGGKPYVDCGRGGHVFDVRILTTRPQQNELSRLLEALDGLRDEILERADELVSTDKLLETAAKTISRVITERDRAERALGDTRTELEWAKLFLQTQGVQLDIARAALDDCRRERDEARAERDAAQTLARQLTARIDALKHANRN